MADAHAVVRDDVDDGAQDGVEVGMHDRRRLHKREEDVHLPCARRVGRPMSARRRRQGPMRHEGRAQRTVCARHWKRSMAEEETSCVSVSGTHASAPNARCVTVAKLSRCSAIHSSNMAPMAGWLISSADAATTPLAVAVASMHERRLSISITCGASFEHAHTTGCERAGRRACAKAQAGVMVAPDRGASGQTPDGRALEPRRPQRRHSPPGQRGGRVHAPPPPGAAV